MKHFFARSLLLVGLVSSLFVSCTKEPDVLPLASPTSGAVAAPSLAEVKEWYGGGKASGTSGAPSKLAAQSGKAKELAISWSKLDTLANGPEPLSWVPIEGTPLEFTSQYQGYRRLVVGRKAGGPSEGVIIEVIHKGEVLADGKLRHVFRALYNARTQPQPVRLADFTGFAALYTRQNHYLTGRSYANGTPSAKPDWLEFKLATKPAGRSNKLARTNDVDITCIRMITHYTTSSEDVIVWTCTVSGGGTGSTGNTGTGSSGDGTGTGTGTGSGGGSGGGGGGGGPINNEPYDDSGNGYGGSGETNSPTTTTTVISSLKPCAQTILVSLQNLKGNDIGGLFQFFSSTPYTSWVIESGYIQPKNGRQVNADTRQDDGMPADYIRTTLNLDFSTKATDVAICRTLIHESMHAYLIRWGYSHGATVNATTSQLVDGYLGTMNPNNAAGQHDAMVSIVNQMARALQTAFPNLNLTNEYAQNLFWAGLTETATYALLPTAQKEAITAAAEAEALSQATAKGTKACN